jgi:hypothetical protein
MLLLYYNIDSSKFISFKDEMLLPYYPYYSIDSSRFISFKVEALLSYLYAEEGCSQRLIYLNQKFHSLLI